MHACALNLLSAQPPAVGFEYEDGIGSFWLMTAAISSRLRLATPADVTSGEIANKLHTRVRADTNLMQQPS